MVTFRTIAITFVTFFLLVCAADHKAAARNEEKASVETPVLSGQSCQDQQIAQDSAGVCAVPETVSDAFLAETAVSICFNGKMPEYALNNALVLLEAERDMSVPEEMRGMTLAAACIESGFNSKAEGDHKFSKDGKTPKAIGILQMWPIYEKAYKVNRRDVKSSAKGWIKHIQAQIPSTKRLCKPSSVEENWKNAWVAGVRAPKKGGRCKENLSHYALFRKIKKSLLKQG